MLRLLPVILFLYLYIPVLSNAKINPNEHIRLLKDENGSLNFKEAHQKYLLGDFDQPNSKVNPYMGFTRSVYWVALEFADFIDPEERYILEIENPMTDSITLYLFNQVQLVSSRTIGSVVPMSNREIESVNPAFQIDGQAFSNLVLLRVHSTAIANYPLAIYEESAFVKKETGNMIMYGIYCGMITLFFLYALVLFINTRNILFLYFSLYVVNTFFILMSLRGLGFVYLWPESILWNYRSPGFFVSIYITLVTGFMYYFLRVKKFVPTVHKLHLTVVLVFFITVFFNFFPDRYLLTIFLNLSAQTLLILFVLLSYTTWRRGHSSAMYYMAGWILFFLFNLPFILKNFGLMDSGFITENGSFIGGLFEIAMFSLAIGRDVRIMNLEKRLFKQKVESYEQELNELNEKLANLMSNVEHQPFGTYSVITQHSINDFLNIPLSLRELDVLYLIIEGKSYNEVSDALFISVNTVKKHIKAIYSKLGVKNRIEAGKKLTELGQVRPGTQN